ncbi:nitrile hydratase subunit beta [Streptomyces sp. NPDC001380]|uniref:nitrile hydratase subunit beta n=1 Tax=Streptomyces sp. NPDC001380 TaxID=3364566 RepID=UPI0036C853E5
MKFVRNGTMYGIADMGGSAEWASARPVRGDEPVFPERWQGRAFALALLSSRLACGGSNIDAFRHALERLDRAAYIGEGYFGRWLNGAELMLTESTVLAPGAIEARSRNLRGEHVEEPPAPRRSRPDYTPAPGSLRTVDAEPAFAVGERVRARNISPPRHTRLPNYVRGRLGVVDAVQPASVLPDTNAHFLGEHPQHVYSVRFDSRELWGSAADPFVITAELYESYLEAAP